MCWYISIFFKLLQGFDQYWWVTRMSITVSYATILKASSIITRLDTPTVPTMTLSGQSRNRGKCPVSRPDPLFRFPENWYVQAYPVKAWHVVTNHKWLGLWHTLAWSQLLITNVIMLYFTALLFFIDKKCVQIWCSQKVGWTVCIVMLDIIMSNIIRVPNVHWNRRDIESSKGRSIMNEHVPAHLHGCLCSAELSAC